MKKLFFTALVAVAAVGGAYAQLYQAGNDNILPCSPGGSGCSITYGNTAYTATFSSGNQNSGTAVDITAYTLD
jgi:hypothetical protein